MITNVNNPVRMMATKRFETKGYPNGGATRNSGARSRGIIRLNG